MEGALASYPAVAAAAAVVIPDALKGEVIKAFVTVCVAHGCVGTTRLFDHGTVVSRNTILIDSRGIDGTGHYNESARHQH